MGCGRLRGGHRLPRWPTLPGVGACRLSHRAINLAAPNCTHTAPSPSRCPASPSGTAAAPGASSMASRGGAHQARAQFTDGPIWSQASAKSARVTTCCLLPRAPRGLLRVRRPGTHAPSIPQGLQAPTRLRQHQTRLSKAHLKHRVITCRGFHSPEESRGHAPPSRKAVFHHQGHDPGYLQTVMRLSTARCCHK